MDKWISVKDRLPEYCGDYLVYVKRKEDNYGFVLMGWYTVGKETEYQWVLNGEFKRLADYVTHWQPLPEPPKESEVK